MVTDNKDFLVDPTKQFRELRERIDSITDPTKQFRELRERIDSITDPTKQFRELRERIDSPFEPLNIPHLSFSEFSPITVETMREDRRRWLEISRSLTISVDSLEGDDVLANAEQLSREVQSISSNSVNLHDFNNRLIGWLDGLSEGAKFVAFYIILPYILSVLAGAHTPLWIDAWRDYSHLPERVAKKEIIKDVTDIFGIDELLEHRFTTASKLRVRKSGTTKSEILDTLAFGTVVRVVDKVKDWTLVEYADAKYQTTKEGWVFSRYLEKFSK